MKQSFYLQLVNPAHPALMIPEDTELLPAHPDYPDILLEAKAAKALQALLTRLDAFDKIVPVSGFRTMQEQRMIWKQSMKDNGYLFTRQYVALPGCSEHQTGLAIDLAANIPDIDFICPDFPSSGIYGRFRLLAASYGFILRYPAGKEHITKISEEPWHFRYVGVPYAEEITRRGIVLEEYLSLDERIVS